MAINLDHKGSANITLKSPDSANTVVLTLPDSDGTADQVLTTDGSGTLSFADAGGTELELYAENPDSPTAPSATGTNAVAIGFDADASGTDSYSFGRISEASDTYAYAFGHEARAQSANALALGRRSTAFNTGAIAIGVDANAAGVNSVAFPESYASGQDSFSAANASGSSSYGATGANSVAIGDLAKATTTNAVCISNTSTASAQNAAVIGGSSSTASGVSSVVIGGSSNTASGIHSFAYGYYGNTNGIRNKVSHGIGPDRQNGMYGLAIDTTDATPASLATDYFSAGSLTQVILPNNSAYAFHGTVVAREKAGDGTDCAAWKIEGLIRREGSAGTTTLVNSATTILDNTPGWGLVLSADTTNGGLAITATGAAATNIRWVATIHSSEVTYA